jgi:Ca2+-binding EF-hand superfamily protein
MHLGTVGMLGARQFAPRGMPERSLRNYEMRSILSVLWLAALAIPATAQFADLPKETPPLMEKKEAKAADDAAGSATTNAIFAVLDADGDGVISKTELRKAIVALKTLDTDKDGQITLAEVGATPIGANAGLAQNPGQNAAAEQMMAQFDRNGDGQLTANEVPPQVQQMLATADTNNNKAIDRQELAAAMQNLPNLGNNNVGGGGPVPGVSGATEQMTGRVMKQYDQNNDGTLSPGELPPQMRRAIQKTDDLDGDGSLSSAELQAAMARMGGAARIWSAGKPPGQANTFRDPNRRKNGNN